MASSVSRRALGQARLAGPSAARLASCANTTRSYSAGLLRARVVPRASATGFAATRSLSLWSSAPPPTSPAPVTPEDAFVPEEAVAATTTPAQPSSIEALTATPSLPPDTASLASTDGVAQAASASTDALASATEPVVAALQAGDLDALGLTGWSPPGLIVRLLELVHLQTGLGWAATIAATTVGLRLLIVRSQVRSQRAAARMLPFKARMNELSLEATEIAKSPLSDEDKRAAMVANAHARMAVNKEAGVKPMDMFAAPLLMLPVQLGLFFGVKRLIDLPLPQLVAEGWEWIPSLAAPDPTWALPLVNAVVIQLALAAAQKDTTDANAAHILNGMRVLSVISVPFLGSLDAALNILILTQSAFGFVQAGVLRMPAVRRVLDLPALDPNAKVPTMADSLQALRAHVEKAKKEAEEMQRRKDEEK